MTPQAGASSSQGPGTTPGSGSPPSSSPAPQAQTAGPVGSGNYVVKQGDCLESIAFKHGHFWQTLWDDPNNQQLRLVRQKPNVLFPGDRVFVPDLRKRVEGCTTNQRHRFKRKGVPSRLVMMFSDEDAPRAGLPYILEIDGKLFSGQTDAQGVIDRPIPPHARRGKLILGTGDTSEEYELELGYLDPVSEISGLQARLNDLGFDCGQEDGVIGPETESALRAFQAEHGLNETGAPDDATRQKLAAMHGA